MLNTIFVVEPDEQAARQLSVYLSARCACKVRSFQSGRACINAALQKPSVICLSLLVFDIPALQLVEQLRSKGYMGPIILLYQAGESDKVLTCLQAGANYFVQQDKNWQPMLLHVLLQALPQQTFLQTAQSLKHVLHTQQRSPGSESATAPAHHQKTVTTAETPADNPSLKDYVQGIIHSYLHIHNHDVLLVAKKLQIGKSTIYNMLRQNKNHNSATP